MYALLTVGQSPIEASKNMLPVLAIPYAVIIVMSIFTSITGMLWALGDRFSKQGTKKFYAIVIGTTAFGVIGGSVLPFARTDRERGLFLLRPDRWLEGSRRVRGRHEQDHGL